jgi:phospho-N-acetylmuramoyl-pentapeptide-transferase
VIDIFDGYVSLPEALALAALSFIATVIVTAPLIRFLRAREFGKAIRADGPDHAAKAGTPTMGGLGMLAVIGVAGGALAWGTGDLVYPIVLVGMFLFGALGLADDLAGLARRSGRRELGVGLSARRMFALQILAAFITVALLLVVADAAASRPYPGAGDIPWGRLAGIVAAYVLLIVGVVNGVNMSDGLDGLAAGLVAIAFVGLAGVIAEHEGYLGPYASYMSHEYLPGQFVFALIVAAACAGFLVYNRHPARVFMGNVTSMALGAGLALTAIVGGLHLILPILAGVFVVEVLSVIVQVGYFKMSGGRRVFRMAPIHHHFELGGWPETKVVKLFWLAGALAAIAAVAATAVLPTVFQ